MNPPAYDTGSNLQPLKPIYIGKAISTDKFLTQAPIRRAASNFAKKAGNPYAHDRSL